MRRTSRLTIAAIAGISIVSLLTACAGGSSADEGEGGGSLQVLFGSSGAAETAALEAAAAAWSEKSGIEVTVTPATDLAQELAQGFATGEPADIFYVSPDQITALVEADNLYPYADKLQAADDFYPELREAYTRDGIFYAAPKDVGALALAINLDLWKAAGLTEADIPTTWDELSAVSARLSADGVSGLTLSPDFARVGPFMLQAGGWVLNDDQTKATADSAENVEALDYVQGLLNDGSATLTTDLGVGWSGEAFGKQMAAMVIEGPWLEGAMAADYPDVDYRVVELPAGPAGSASMFFTNAWGIAAESKNKDAAVEFVEFLTSPEQQMEFARAFGPIPARQSAANAYRAEFPDTVAYLDGVEGAKTYPTISGFSEVMADMNAQLSELKRADVSSLLASAQKNLEALTK
jgi:multiple sugar transport system substrate-binding protein